MSYADAQARVAAAKAAGETELNLNELALTDADLAALVQPEDAFWQEIRTLNLRDNQLQDLTPLSGLTGLTALFLSNNLIVDLEPLRTLVTLTDLRLASNKIVRIDALRGLTGLMNVSLSGNQVSDIYPLNGLTNLMTLTLNQNPLIDLSPLSGLTSLTGLWLNQNQLSDISFLNGLTNLIKLGLSQNQLSDISPLSGLANLTGLGLEQNQLNDLTPLSGLINLTELWLSQNQLSDISPLSGLTNLITLVLDQNHLSDISPLSGLTNLAELWLNQNQLSDISALSGLMNITKIVLIQNQVSDLSPLSGLTNLKELWLIQNQLSDLSPLSELTNLTELGLSQNQLSDLSPLSGLMNLTELWLRQNQLSDISPLSGLVNLTVLSLFNNQIRSFPEQVLHLPALEELYIAGNPLHQIPASVYEVFDEDGDPANVLEPLRAFVAERKEKLKTLYECKLMLVGNGDTGKTSLMRKLMQPNARVTRKEDTTRGIEVQRWSWPADIGGQSREVTVNIWDFGGQNMYNPTHQLFLTDQTLYLFVWDARKGRDQSRFDYWLNVIQLLGKDSPILVVMNKKDQRHEHLNKTELQERYPNIQGFYEVSSKTGEGIDDLRAGVQAWCKQLINEGETWGESRAAVRDHLLDLAKERPFLPVEAYRNLCTDGRVCAKGALDPEAADALSQKLHRLGQVLHFREDKVLKHRVILRPSWGKDAAYKVLDTKEVENANGYFDEAALRRIWKGKEYAGSEEELLHLMLKFEMCFELQDSQPRQFVVPALLPAEPETQPVIGGKHHLRFEYRYRFMPEGILIRFMCRNYRAIDGQVFWRDGVQLHFPEINTRAVLRSESLSRRIRIELAGEDPKTALELIRRDMNSLHHSLNLTREDDKVQEMIPCICPNCQETTDPYLFSFRRLKEYEKNQVLTINCENKGKITPVDVQALIRGTIQELFSQELAALQINNMIASGMTDDAIKLAIEYYPERNEFVHLSGWNSRIKMMRSNGVLDTKDFIQESNKISHNILNYFTNIKKND